MSHIAILSTSIRDGRMSHRPALFLERHITAGGIHTVDLIDLKALDLPLYHERLRYMNDPPTALVEFAERIRKAHGVIIVSPEYNGAYPASLKNVIDVITQDWKRKPIGLCSVSSGSFGGTQMIAALAFTLWKIRAWVVGGPLQVPMVQDQFQEDGNPNDREDWERRANAFLAELEWAMKASERMS